MENKQRLPIKFVDKLLNGKIVDIKKDNQDEKKKSHILLHPSYFHLIFPKDLTVFCYNLISKTV